MNDTDEASPSSFQIHLHRLSMRYQSFLDKVTPFGGLRWSFSLFSFFFYCIRVYTLQGFHIISYGLGIYLLNLFIGFLTPMVDPAVDSADDGLNLPMKSGDEFKPFIRRLPEFKFWLSSIKALLISIVCTFFACLDIPVFWPILVVYFILLFLLTMKRQIKVILKLLSIITILLKQWMDIEEYQFQKHMIKYRYIPFTYGKPHHPGSGKPVKKSAS